MRMRMDICVFWRWQCVHCAVAACALSDQLSLTHACHHSLSAKEHASARPWTDDAAQPWRFAKRHLYGGEFTDKVRLNVCMERGTDRWIGYVCMHED